ncbi:hypothetical protein [Cyanobium sp. LEGE 06113]|uniref:hypothetical protein n=1 Tax=Cyanobium sp. LEGE 06113 TaxID=1297573 RepID=UPI001882FB04|nr:hypothetical protein [Cyanobium sp. LEGE 06113]MBE9154219.1 hypothetical protein [Cyanobium sp. LEGE 06113]
MTAPRLTHAISIGRPTGMLLCLLLTLTTAAARANHLSQHRSPPMRRPLPLPEAPAQNQATLLQKLRELIGYNPRQAVGGSRSGSAGQLCLITPRFRQRADGVATAVVSSPTPALLAAGPLNEVRLERDGRILWGRRASSSHPITGAIPWPLSPLQPGETVTLRLRPQGAAGADFASVELQAAAAAEQQRAEKLLADQAPRLELIEAQALQGRSALASELLFAPMQKTPAAIISLRRQLIEQGCGINSATP